MQVDPSTINAETASDVNSALNLTDQYAESGLSKVTAIAEIVGGKEVKKYGLTTENLKRVMVFVGAYTTLKFAYEKAGKHKFKILGALVGIYAIRVMTEKKSGTTTVLAKSSIPNNPSV